MSPLDRLAAALRKRALTARQIATWLKCSKPTAYARIRALEKRGEPIRQEMAQTPTRTGPRAILFSIKA